MSMTKARAVVLCLIFFLAASQVSTKHYRGQNYVSLEEAKKQMAGVSFDFDHLSLVLEAQYRQKSVQVLVDKNFYVSGNEHYSIIRPLVYYRGQVMLSQGMIEELISEFGLKINYQFKKKKLVVKTSKKAVETPSSGKSDLDFIVIDPGHGGHDPGAQGSLNTREKVIALKVSQYVFRHLKKAFPQTKIYITRYNDRFISLERRSEIANGKIRGKRFGLFLSLHCNAHLSPRINGYEIYYLAHNASNESARQVMIRENRMARGKSDVRRLESRLIEAQVQSESKVLARELDRAFKTKLSRLVKSRGVKRADFAVLRGSLMPSVLVEMGYLTNRAEASVLQSVPFRQKLALGLEKGIKRFMQRRPTL